MQNAEKIPPRTISNASTTGAPSASTARRAVVGTTATAPQQQSWLEERLGLEGLMKKYGRKAFPVHTTFFLGEMSLFSFVILVATGAYLALLYIPSNSVVRFGTEDLPQAYASVRFIESLPVANIFRNVHHWSAHLMIASTIMHALRIYFFGTYRKPRELNWVTGVVLLILTIGAGFMGYALPYDAYSVVATGIGFGIAKSIPWIGNIAADLVFGGTYPTLGSLPRLYALHIFVLPLLIAGGIAAHLLIIVKQKHSQPGYAKRLAEPGKVLGVPLWPYQAILAIQLLLFMFGGLFVLSAFIPVHPLDAYGPPGVSSLEAKPDWYLMWVYGFLKMVPSFDLRILGTSFNQEFFGGLLFPGVIFGIWTLVPWLDRTNRRALNKYYEYLEPPAQAPTRLASGVAMLAFLAMTFVAAYKETLGPMNNLFVLWATTILVTVGVFFAVQAWATNRVKHRVYFDPTGTDAHHEDTTPVMQEVPLALSD